VVDDDDDDNNNNNNNNNNNLPASGRLASTDPVFMLPRRWVCFDF
jgi:hypothetical protein